MGGNTTAFAVFITAVGGAAQAAWADPTVSVIVAGMAGGAVRWYTEREPWRVGLGSMVIGGICARYLGPLAIGLTERTLGINITDNDGTTGAFLMGLGGIMIIKYIMDKIKHRSENPDA